MNATASQLSVLPPKYNEQNPPASRAIHFLEVWEPVHEALPKLPEHRALFRQQTATDAFPSLALKGGFPPKILVSAAQTELAYTC
mmetsp:Transcript_22708/g.48195  ORF Transcript_22708/g.48195 Transcript_22708/m.48195 type:complete len:85 (+) Transcript_22708:703-957(+)